MPHLPKLTLCLLAWIPVSLCKITTVEEHAVLEGQSVTVPCHYEPQYASYVKYWCQGRVREICTSLARTDTPLSGDPATEKARIYDDPVQLVFTVTMTGLKEADTGWYWCGVEVGGMWSADDATSTYINVVHGMAVVNSRLSGEEGSSVTVECLYSEKYRETEKKWCRSGDWSSCLLTGSEGSYDDTSVAISDDRSGAFTVTLKKLRMRDAGWYWCAAGQQQMAVHVLVTLPASTTAVPVTSPPTANQSVAYLPPPKHITKESWDTHRHMFESVVVCVSLMLLVGMAILARKMWKQHSLKRFTPIGEKGQMQAEEQKARLELQEYPGEAGDLHNGTVVFHNKVSQLY